MPVATNRTCSAPLASRVHFGFACLLYALHGFFAWFPRMPHMPSSNRFLACFASHAFASAKPKGVFFNCHFCLDICTFFTTIKWSHFMVHFWLREFILESLWESLRVKWRLPGPPLTNGHRISRRIQRRRTLADHNEHKLCAATVVCQ